jgi:hypothetical protein
MNGNLCGSDSCNGHCDPANPFWDTHPRRAVTAPVECRRATVGTEVTSKATVTDADQFWHTLTDAQKAQLLLSARKSGWGPNDEHHAGAA